MRNESEELGDVREMLASLEKHMVDEQGVYLVDQITEVVTETAEDGYASEREERVIGNLVRTHAKIARDVAEERLADFDSISNEAALCLHHVMQKLAQLGDLLPEGFDGTRFQLLETIAERTLHHLLSPPQRSGDHGPFVASPRRHLFHRLECIWASYVIDPVEYATHEQAVGAGRKPCKTCRA